MPAAQTDTLLQMRSISKRFPGVQALDRVSVEVKRGEVHGLVGENGAGKSTLLKILSGVHRPDTGSVEFDGQPYRPGNPLEAQRRGIAIIYQELSLIPDVSFAENIFAGRLAHKAGAVQWREVYARAGEALAKLGIEADPRMLVRDVGVGVQQLVEIARALASHARLILMDEPTSALSDQEAERLFQVIHTLKGQGVTVVYISHRLDELFRVCDRVTVLRDGTKVGTKAVADTTREELIEMMVGRELDDVFPKTNTPTRREVLRVAGLRRRGTPREVSLSVHAGEIVGVAGLMGAGRTELLRAIFGADPVEAKEVFVDGDRVSIDSPADAIHAGIALVTEDRRGEGLFLGMALDDNMAYPILPRLAGLLGRIDHGRKRALAQQRIAELGVSPPNPSAKAGQLSGGNQQKVVLGKWLNAAPKAILLDEPTRGIDVGAKAEIHRVMSQLADRGVGILMVSSELPEVIGMSDRVLVMRDGVIAKELPRGRATQQEIMHWAIGE